MKRRAGFTLIEVLISITILAVLGALIARTVQQGIKAKVKIQGQLDQVSKMRDALRLIERDVNQAFHYRDIQKELADLVKKSKRPRPNPGVPNPNPGPIAEIPAPPPESPRPNVETQFDGTEDAIHFVTMSDSRLIRDLRQADFIEVGYFLKDCQSTDGTRSSKCLWRRTSAVVDDEVSKGGEEFPLLENVTEFSLQYLGKGKQDWVKTWRSFGGSDALTEGRYPLAVQISLSADQEEKGKKKKYSMQIVSSIHFPNNKEEASSDSPTTTNTGN